MGNKQRTVFERKKTRGEAASFAKERWASIWHGNMALALPQRGRLGHLVMSTQTTPIGAREGTRSMCSIEVEEVLEVFA